MKARFEEAKQKELAMVAPCNSQGNQRTSGSQSNAHASQSQLASLSENLVKNSGRSATLKKSYFNCGLDTHLVKDCPYPKQPRRDREACRTNSAVAVVTPTEETRRIMDKISTLRKDLKEKQVLVAMEWHFLMRQH